MPITAIAWADDAECDIHMLRGTNRPALRVSVMFTRSDGVVEDAATYLAANADVTLNFQPSFKNVMDVTVNPPTCTGFGITINNDTGEIRVDPPPTPGPVIHNFLVHATAQDSSDAKEYRISIRVHLHNRVASAWLTPPILTLRPESGALPQTTRVRFSVRAQFDDQTIGDLTHHPDIVWRPAANVAGTGRLIIAPGNGPSTPAVQIEAVLPADLQDPVSANATRNQSGWAYTFRSGLGVRQQRARGNRADPGHLARHRQSGVGS